MERGVTYSADFPPDGPDGFDERSSPRIFKSHLLTPRPLSVTIFRRLLVRWRLTRVRTEKAHRLKGVSPDISPFFKKVSEVSAVTR